MNLYFFDADDIVTFTLPDKMVGNFWLTDKNGKNVVNISAANNEWVLSGGSHTKIYFQNNLFNEIVLKNKNYYVIDRNNVRGILFVDNIVDNSFNKFQVLQSCDIVIGKENNCSIICDLPYLSNIYVTLNYSNNSFSISNFMPNFVYLNGRRVENLCALKNGDVINICGLRIVFLFNLIFINNPVGNLKINSNFLASFLIQNVENVIDDLIEDVDLYSEEDYFLKSPRLRQKISTLEMKIDSPPSKEEVQEMPLIYTLGPMLTMGASSIINLTTAIQAINNGEKTFKSSIPTLAISGAMIMSMLVWPFLTKSYEKKRRENKEKRRQTKYKAYLESKKNELENEYKQQIQILNDTYFSTYMCYDIIINKQRILWERKLEQNDFLTAMVGRGHLPFDAQINYQSEDFTMEDDSLKKKLEELIAEYKIMNNVPITYSFLDNNITAISGLYPKYYWFANNILLQFMAYHSYDDLKIVCFTNKNNANNWDYLKSSPYCFSDDRYIRFFATSTEEMQEVSLYLEQVFNNRKTLVSNDTVNSKDFNYSSFNNYYLIVIDDIYLARKIGIVENILESKKNLGFSIIILENKLSKLPSEVNNFISIGDKTSGILKNDMNSNEQILFANEINNSYDMNYVSYLLSNLPIYIENNSNELPNIITFLEMYGVGEIEQLNAITKWKENDPTKSLKAEIGVNENGEKFYLDIHEKQHGPHGLVAGMTGSGKSEFIITYILSMAVNYSPEEVAFVLIDYKGGGLAGAFENKETGIKLPHVVGTITNLDKAEINRSLASINSELRRRQEKFNETRENTGESTIDIYKYQKMYRDGVVDEPIPHLIIVCDEFAELKNQQPEFMEDLISAARIGRSLGVHLILATQKPSGVVDGQIWSNSKFKICLKVQDKSDSMEMINTSLAAELKNVGRFYLQVGYNEYFAMGQSSWAGAPYYPSKEFKKQVDKRLYIINNVGAVIKGVDNNLSKKVVKSCGEELSNILKYLIDVSGNFKFNIKQLWLDRISNEIYIDSLKKKYNYNKVDFNINPVIGEYDDPTNQNQGLLTLPITNDGNVLLYGMADSGKDEFLQSLVYSLITTYSTSELNLYLLDFGAETLINFNDAPQVGDVVLNGDDEKLNNLFKMLFAETNKRKKQFISFNGNYKDFIINSGKKLPNIVVIINFVEVLSEISTNISDNLATLMRESAKYGINFVITTTNQNSVRFKVAQNCKQLLCLQMNDENSYRDILGRTNGLVPFKCLGRGLVKFDKVCEFQTAFIKNNEEKFNFVKDIINDLSSKMKKVKKIPVMPEIIKISGFKEKYTGISNIPIGINKDNLISSLYDFSKNGINLISSNEMDSMMPFILNFLKLVESNNSFNKIVIDASNYFNEFNYNINFYLKDFDKVVDYLKDINNQIQDIYTNSNFNIRSLSSIANNMIIIIGFEKFFSKLDDDYKKSFKEILNKNKDTNKLNFVFVDIHSNIKKYEYDEWYKNCVDNNDGLWVGEGITQQYLIKLSSQPAGISNISNEYGVLVKNGVPTVVKLVNEIKVDN